jgi:hypothetical protein
MRHGYFVIVALVVLMALACSRREGCDGAGHHRKVMSLAAEKHGCPDVRIRRSGDGWRQVEVCGVRRVYEYRRWCCTGWCDFSWRETTTKGGG